MCHQCGAQSMDSSNCVEEGKTMESNNGGPVKSCDMCVEDTENVVVKDDDFNPRQNPSINSIASLKTSDSCISSSSDLSVDANSYARGDVVASGTDSGQEDTGSSLNAHLPNFTVPAEANGIHSSNTQEENDPLQSGSRASQSVKEDNELPSTNNETDVLFWLPPEPDDGKHDVVSSYTTYDDDDEDDNIHWRNTDSLTGFDEEGSGSYNYKEEKRKALDEVMNGKFKAFLKQLLISQAVTTSENDGESWVDIVASLSWQAALYLKPDNSEAKSTNPAGFVKIKCIATGSPVQCKVIKGLVFKKHAAHKRMPAKYSNPKFLLIRGALGLSSSGLSSFQSMAQEKDSERDTIIGMIETYHPNVILVEKTVSRDIQESILAKGMTLVLDMKLQRLERVARCIGSPILSSDSSLSQNLRHCDSFHFEKFVEEYAPFDDSGKRPSKTLMFIEGCPTRLGCTILLMGASSDVLKKIKYVVNKAVVMAYHFMLETSFLLDQRAMFSTVGVKEVFNATVASSDMSIAATNSRSVTDIPISNGFNKEGSHYLSSSSPLPSGSRESIPDHFSSDENDHDDEIRNIEIEDQISSPNVEDHIDEASKTISGGEKLLNAEQLQLYPTSTSIEKPLDSESILVLISSRNASTGTMCEHSHFSHIKFYKNFDVRLGKFLRDYLLNQRLQCKACGEAPEAHIFYYAHHNKQLTIQVRRLSMGKPLPGENEGKLWMWSRCGRCKFHKGSPTSTKLALLSSAACGLSFGKFLELSFSNNSIFDRPSSCGHSLHRDFLNFFGLGPMVAIFKYSPLATYSVALPAEKLDFSNTITGEYLKKDFEDVYANGIMIFLEIENSLKALRPQFEDLSLNLRGSIKKFSDIEEMLKQEKSQFEVDIQNAVHNGNQDEAAYKNLSLNRVRLELLLESCVWDRRLHSLLSSDLSVMDTKAIDHSLKEDGNAIEELLGTEVTVESHNIVMENNSFVKIELEASVEGNDFPVKEIPIYDEVNDSEKQNVLVSSPSIDENINENGSSVEDHHVAEPDITVTSHYRSESFPRDSSSIQLQIEKISPLTTDIGLSALDLSNSEKGKSTLSLSFKLENDKVWIWTPFSEILMEYMNDLLRGSLTKFGSITSYAHETAAYKMIIDEGSRLHIPLGSDGYILSDYENEYSSIIACALALLKDLPLANDKKAFDAKAYENLHILPRLFSLTPHWSSTSSWDSDGYFQSSTYSEDSHHSSFDGSDLLDSQVSLGSIHAEISMGMVKLSGKRKYSVICLYASQFRQLRNRWCPSEVDYIASLSRCKNWDAKGGKSKAFFAKTLDDRFIIKEIKRTEFDSFVQFAPNYFDYMNQCYEHQNQTCLAKILGIYQVIVRQAKSGKETRHDLMVMENLSFGRSFARSYDLKGALHARLITTGDGSGDVLLDQNFVNDMNDSPLYVTRKSKRNLQRGVWNDTTFLYSINVMDYSLLVGVDTERKELVCGIIDYLRQYTWDKQLETWVKSSLVLPKNQLPTVISPKEYKKRFRKFIDTHFFCVPDHWSSQKFSHPCELCGREDSDSSVKNIKSQKLEKHQDDLTRDKSREEKKDEDDSAHDKPLEEEKLEDDSICGKSPEEEKHEDDLTRDESREEEKHEDDSDRGESREEEKHEDDSNRGTSREEEKHEDDSNRGKSQEEEDEDDLTHGKSQEEEKREDDSTL